jgi:hypothetical protein
VIAATPMSLIGLDSASLSIGPSAEQEEYVSFVSFFSFFVGSLFLSSPSTQL